MPTWRFPLGPLLVVGCCTQASAVQKDRALDLALKASACVGLADAGLRMFQPSTAAGIFYGLDIAKDTSSNQADWICATGSVQIATIFTIIVALTQKAPLDIGNAFSAGLLPILFNKIGTVVTAKSRLMPMLSLAITLSSFLITRYSFWGIFDSPNSTEDYKVMNMKWCSVVTRCYSYYAALAAAAAIGSFAPVAAVDDAQDEILKRWSGAMLQYACVLFFIDPGFLTHHNQNTPRNKVVLRAAAYSVVPVVLTSLTSLRRLWGVPSGNTLAVPLGSTAVRLSGGWLRVLHVLQISANVAAAGMLLMRS